ncbi:MAG TPA: hypothetical protein VGX92_10095 [Pyrinomonadaceae bacterium]|jgi:hypothetical protein|nr:hypothetical protein [Pyrinomonadaceae bacterium]
MLFIESRISNHRVEAQSRLQLLEKLQDKGLIPLIRSARLHCFELALMSPERAPDMERAVAAQATIENDAPYVRGDLFCFEDFVLYLIFGDEDEAVSGMRAGIVYEAETQAPLLSLDSFCRNVREALEATRSSRSSSNSSDTNGNGETTATTAQEEPIVWRGREPRDASRLMRFQDGRANGVADARRVTGAAQLRAVELLEDAGARRFLWRISEAQATGRAGGELQSEVEAEGGTDSLVGRLSDAGLLRREVVVSCRKVGRSLFRLPSSDALNVITSSNATCSECGASIADEKVDELIVPTDTASTLLENGSWLSTRLYSVLRGLGIPESRIALGPPASDGEINMMADICGETFLFVLRDGDLAATHARHALDRQVETEAAHLVVVATGKIQDEARIRLREHARRRARAGGREVEVLLVEGVNSAINELQHAFERVSQRALSEELCALDAALGLSVGHMISTRFRLMQKSGALSDLAESAVGALAGSLREI